MWHVPNEKWNLLPKNHWRQELCVKDFRRLLREAGHDPQGIPISYQPWRNKLEAWHNSSKAPPNHVHIHFSHPEPSVPETMWCEVLSQHVSGYMVRLWNNSIFEAALKRGSLLLAYWDQQTVHGLTGRPLLVPIRRLRSLTTS